MKKIVAQIRRQLAGGNIGADFPWGEREISQAITQAWAELTRYEYLQNLKDGQVGLSSVGLVEYLDLVPQKDVLGRWYIDLPTKPIDVGSRWKLGINHVGPQHDLNTSFKLVDATTQSMWGKTVNNVGVGQKRIQRVGDKRIFFLDMKEPCDLIIRIFTTEPDDNATIPDYMVPQIAERIRNLYQPGAPRDEENDQQNKITNSTPG